MPRSAYLVSVALLLVCLPTSAPANIVTIPDVPTYIWYYGCGPTAVGMVVGYWDAHGYPNLITAGDGTNSWSTNQQAVKDMIASPGHIRDFAPTPDRVATPADPYHPYDCVADFMYASRDPLAMGDSYTSNQCIGMTNYAKLRGYSYTQAGDKSFTSLWSTFVTEVNAGRPMEFYVDSNADGKGDHFVTVIGYDDASGAQRYAYYDTWHYGVQWSAFAAISAGQSFGVGQGYWFKFTSTPVTLQWRGPFVSNTWDVGITANWLGDTGDYRTFRNGDNAQFGDFLAPTATVNVSTVVKPGSVVVDNSTTDYEFAGAGSIAGPTGLVKRGSARLTLANTNTYTGDTEIRAGTLVVAAAGALGAGAVRLGATTGSDSASLLVSGALVVDRHVTVQSDGSGTSTRTLGGTNTAGTAVFSGGITVKDDLTLTAAPGGTVSLTGLLDDLTGKTLTKIGGGTLVIDGPQEYGPGSVWNVNEGAVFMQTDAGGDETAYLTVNVGGAGTDASVIFGSDEHLVMLHIMSAGVATLGAGCHVLVLDSLWIDGFGPPLTNVRLYNTPEPATLVLLALGCAGLAAGRARKRLTSSAA